MDAYHRTCYLGTVAAATGSLGFGRCRGAAGRHRLDQSSLIGITVEPLSRTTSRRLAAWLAPLVLALASCANISEDFAFDAAKDTGVVIGSISYESGYGRYMLTAKEKSTGKPVSFGFGCTLVPCFTGSDDQRFSKNETPQQRGGGFAVEVPAGEYQITGWLVLQGQKRSFSTMPIDLAVTVAKGKASYIGNLHFDADWENVQLRDKAERDLPILREEYEVLRSAPLAFSIAAGTRIEHLGGDGYQTRYAAPVFIPIVPVK